MPIYQNVKNSVELVEEFLAAIGYPYSADRYSSAVWTDKTNFKMVYLHIKEQVVTVEVWHRHDKNALLGERVAFIELNQILKTCQTAADITDLALMVPEDFMKHVTREIVALGSPVKMEGEKLKSAA